MNAEIVSIGTELLLGEIVNTNETHIARTLRDIGVNIYFMTTVGDNQQRIIEVLQQGLNRSGLIITTGGLGPTVDDVTRQAVAAATNRPLVFHQELYDQIADRFARFGSRMSENNRQQAYIPENAIPIENPVGTAPCYIVESDVGIIISLPGVPREMKYLLTQAVIPYLQEKMGAPKIIKALVLRTAGIGESHLDEFIADLMTHANPTVGLAAHTGQTDIRITARANTHSEADSMISDMESTIRQRVGSFIYGINKDSLEEAVVHLLGKHNLKIAISETGTNGTLRQRLEAIDPSIIQTTHLYQNVADLLKSLDQSETPLETTALIEGQRLLADSAATLAISIVTNNSGTTIVVLTPEDTRKRSYAYGGEETQAPEWAATWGLSMAWRLLKERETTHG